MENSLQLGCDDNVFFILRIKNLIKMVIELEYFWCIDLLCVFIDVVVLFNLVEIDLFLFFLLHSKTLETVILLFLLLFKF